MSVCGSVRVSVPATTANLGPGFDCLGAALSLSNRFRFLELSPEDGSLRIIVSGVEGERLATDENNLVYRAFVKLYQHLERVPPPVEISIELGFPLARGLGSSATAIVGGLLGANVLAGSPVDRQGLMELAIAVEGHPDNVVPAMLGGCRLSVASSGSEVQSDCDRNVSSSNWTICEIPWHPALVPVVAMPDFELSTEASRRVLPEQYSRADTIFNLAHVGLLLRGLETGNGDWLRVALQDRIHQPYRRELIPGYDAVRLAALEAGAYGLTISGAGPTVLALTTAATAEAVAAAMAAAWAKVGRTAQVRVLALDTAGAVCMGEGARE